MKFQSITTAAAAALIACASAAAAQDYPRGNITFTVPFPPGGGTDIPARMIVDSISRQTGWTFVVQNQPGAGGNIGLAQVARTTPDGMNIGMGQTSNLAVNPTLYPDIPYDVLNDFTPIAVVTSQPMAIVTHAGSPFETFADVIEAARAAPGDVLYGTPGAGTVAHLSVELLSTENGLEMAHVPYPGIAQAISDVMAGGVDIYVGSVPSVLPHIRSGSLRALAVTAPERNPALPETPAVAEFGFEGFNTADWKAIVGPANLSPEVVATLNTAINAALEDPTLRAALEAEGSVVVGGTPEEFQAFLAEQVETWAEVVRASGATVN
ncbi:Bug family tripartite tricarboxylate transporter substrate binding protein [Ketogulonicigenium vulgare]|uniref:Twin-arginine translocation pathway signal n=1 Tax=Ketogulonicigenium vulgare (strain WSH-001) TaxID=759362 RepID=F9YB03_KETVW|nr:tripartite tricarboxylate transporter substrate binding protein [Ketogulonicigenium vulgare]ADO44028.1 conserved hypothetical protein UPF0065 [Ketogulonicigenium vulgare Y25]AEM42555.1 Twin-arginine translocation pathway signal [Ketogulonicigenium vulgare WSH-001]ALJ82587.1 LacI family transcriptional regulator [Ketogulonicigenium vulgare]ANW35347.1 LacI family transcriptional regulator [Ketogulonicigenium vulgare]AOZ53257.1 extra-cytoplasmic solute receptor [Ketogulonicigenium vulgare]